MYVVNGMVVIVPASSSWSPLSCCPHHLFEIFTAPPGRRPASCGPARAGALHRSARIMFETFSAPARRSPSPCHSRVSLPRSTQLFLELSWLVLQPFIAPPEPSPSPRPPGVALNQRPRGALQCAGLEESFTTPALKSPSSPCCLALLGALHSASPEELFTAAS